LPLLSTSSLVVKPDQSEGCIGIRLATNEHELYKILERLCDLKNWLVQPYLAGQSASLSLMVGYACVCLLGTNKPHVVQINDSLKLLDFDINSLQGENDKLLEMAKNAYAAGFAPAYVVWCA